MKSTQGKRQPSLRPRAWLFEARMVHRSPSKKMQFSTFNPKGYSGPTIKWWEYDEQLSRGYIKISKEPSSNLTYLGWKYV